MALTYTNFDNGDSLLIVREKLNTFNNSVVVDVNTNTTKVDNQGTQVIENADNIVVLETAVEGNIQDIAAIPIVNNLDDLGDVNTTTVVPTTNAPLRFDGTNFVADKHDLDVARLTVDNNIKFIKMSTPEYEGMTVQMGVDGLLTLVRVPQQAHIQEDLYNTDTFVQTNPVEFWRITSDVEYGGSDSDMLIHAVFDNNSGTDRQVTFTFKANNGSVGTKTYTVWGDAESHEITFTQSFDNVHPVGTIFTVEMTASRDDDIRIKGTLQNGIFRLRKTDTTSALVEAQIVQLNRNAPFVPIYEYVKEGIPNGGNPIVISSNSYQPVANLNPVGTFPAGTYSIDFSSTFYYDSTNRSAMWTWSVDGGTTWEDFSVEPKDASDTKALHYSFPHEHLGGGIDLVLQAKCENANDILTVKYANIVFERKK